MLGFGGIWDEEESCIVQEGCELLWSEGKLWQTVFKKTALTIFPIPHVLLNFGYFPTKK